MVKCNGCQRDMGPHILYEHIGGEPYCLMCADNRFNSSYEELANWLEALDKVEPLYGGSPLYHLTLTHNTTKKIVIALRNMVDRSEE